MNALAWAHWWLKGWVALLAATCALGLSVLWFQWRLRRLFSRTLELENRVDASAGALARANLALEEATLVDPLTGLHNRRFLEVSLATDAQQAQRAFTDMLAEGLDPLAAREDLLLFLLDLDHFQRINETWGRDAGDAVLHQLGQALKTITRKTDYRVRWEGGKLLLVARRARRSGAPTVARNLLAAVRDLNFQLPGGETVHKRISIGFTALPFHPRHPDLGTWQQGLAVAEQCLAAAKKTGRDRWVGATLRPDAEPEALRGLAFWEVGGAVAQGLAAVQCSEPGFRWPAGP